VGVSIERTGQASRQTPRRRGADRSLARGLWLFCAIFVVYGTSIPFQFAWDPAAAAQKLAHLPLDITISPETGRRVSIPDVVQNVLLFVPFGITGFLAMSRRVPRPFRIVLVSGAGALLSTSVEVMQLFTVDRTTSLTDLVTNTAGALIGALAAGLLADVASRSMETLAAIGVTRARTFYPMMLATLLVCITALQPFDPSLDVGSLVFKLRALLADPWQTSLIADDALEVLRFMLLTVVLRGWLRELYFDRATLLAAAAGVLAAFALEGAQFIIQSRMPGLIDALVHSAGALAGVVVARASETWRPSLRVGAIAAATTVGATIMVLNPFSWASRFQPMEWIPFLSYYEFTSVQTVSHVVELMAAYAPLGFAVAAAGVARPLATGALMTFVLATPLEYLQGWVAGRHPDVTDIGVSLLGGLIGAWLGGPGWVAFGRYVDDLGARTVRRTGSRISPAPVTAVAASQEQARRL
jgi:glycopeptide antibiotics resistance protein